MDGRDGLTANTSIDAIVRGCIEEGDWDPDFTNVSRGNDIWALQWTCHKFLIQGLIIRPFEEDKNK